MQTIQITTKENYQIIQLKRGKVNAINQQMVSELQTAVAEAQADEAVGGLIITGTPNFLSAGLDVKEIYGYNEDEIRIFFKSFFDLHIQLVRFTKPLVFAINGYSPAGGTVLAIAADYRIMVRGEKFVIGLNEMAVNIQIPQTIADAYSFWLGSGKANEYLLEGKLLHNEEALNSGLVNKLVEADELMDAAENQLKKYLSADQEIFRNTKRKIRGAWLASLYTNQKEEMEQTVSLWWKPSVRAKMKAFVESLSK